MVCMRLLWFCVADMIMHVSYHSSSSLGLLFGIYGLLLQWLLERAFQNFDLVITVGDMFMPRFMMDKD